MPLSTSLPAQALEWEQEWMMPLAVQNPISFPGTSPGLSGSIAGVMDKLGQRTPTSWSTLPSPLFGGALQPYGLAGSFGRIRYKERLGKLCLCLHTDAVATFFGGGWRPPEWLPMFGPAAGMAPGARLMPASVVGVFDWEMSVLQAGAVPTWPNDVAGPSFLPVATGVNAGNIPGAAGADIGGFGVFNNAVGGASVWQYVSWATGNPGAILERVSLPVAAVANWNTIRFVIISAASGREAQLRVSMNGVQLVQRDFGSAELDRPNTSTALAMGMSSNMVGAFDNATDDMLYRLSARFGRFTPEGEELQGQ